MDMIDTVICGDCLQVMRGMDDNSVDLVLTDPPYGINYQSNMRKDRAQRKPKIANDKEPFVAWISDAFRVLKSTGRLICFYRWDVQEAFLAEVIRCGFNPKSQIVWDKVSHGMGDLKGEFAPQHENILYATKGRYKFQAKRPKTIIQCMKVMPDKLLHPNEKPVKLIRRLVRKLTAKGDMVLDCFLGAGTSAIACIQEERHFIGIEISEDYCKIAEKRIQEERDKYALFND